MKGYLYQVRTVRCHVCVLGVSSQRCICVLGVSSQDSVCVRGIKS